MVFIGLFAMHDPIRKETGKAIELCRQAGMNPIIVTGDHKLTAQAVASQLGFKINKNNILEGKDLEKLSDEELEKKIKKYFFLKIFIVYLYYGRYKNNKKRNCSFA